MNNVVYIVDKKLLDERMSTFIYLISLDTGEIIAKDDLEYSIFGGNEEEIRYTVRNMYVYKRYLSNINRKDDDL